MYLKELARQQSALNKRVRDQAVYLDTLVKKQAAIMKEMHESKLNMATKRGPTGEKRISSVAPNYIPPETRAPSTVSRNPDNDSPEVHTPVTASRDPNNISPAPRTPSTVSRNLFRQEQENDDMWGDITDDDIVASAEATEKEVE